MVKVHYLQEKQLSPPMLSSDLFSRCSLKSITKSFKITGNLCNLRKQGKWVVNENSSLRLFVIRIENNKTDRYSETARDNI